MKIESYEFGRIVVDGKEYTRDLILFSSDERVADNWWRKSGHLLHLEDLDDMIYDPPEVLIVGTGRYSRMRVPDKLVTQLGKRGTDVRVIPTTEACKLYNEIGPERDVVAALHLTC